MNVPGANLPDPRTFVRQIAGSSPGSGVSRAREPERDDFAIANVGVPPSAFGCRGPVDVAPSRDRNPPVPSSMKCRRQARAPTSTRARTPRRHHRISIPLQLRHRRGKQRALHRVRDTASFPAAGYRPRRLGRMAIAAWPSPESGPSPFVESCFSAGHPGSPAATKMNRPATRAQTLRECSRIGTDDGAPSQVPAALEETAPVLRGLPPISLHRLFCVI